MQTPDIVAVGKMACFGKRPKNGEKSRKSDYVNIVVGCAQLPFSSPDCDVLDFKNHRLFRVPVSETDIGVIVALKPLRPVRFYLAVLLFFLP